MAKLKLRRRWEWWLLAHPEAWSGWPTWPAGRRDYEEAHARIARLRRHGLRGRVTPVDVVDIDFAVSVLRERRRERLIRQVRSVALD